MNQVVSAVQPDSGEPPGSGGSDLVAVILTRNESRNIEACLSCLKWVSRVVLVDSFSDDTTIELARNIRSDIVVLQRQFDDFGQQRNFAIDAVGDTKWILFLDADEHCTPELAAEICRVTSQSSEIAGYFLTCRNIFLNRWIRRCTLYPSWQLRLLRVGQVRYRKEGHGQREVSEGRIGYLKAPYDHFGFSQGIAHWIARHNRYSSEEVELIQRLRTEPLALTDLFASAVDRRRTMKRIASRTGLFRPWFRFFYLYIVQMGFLDGYPGLIFCLLRLSQELHIVAKLAESQLQPPGFELE